MKRHFVAAIFLCSVALFTVGFSCKQAELPAHLVRVMCLPARPLALSVAIDRGLLKQRGIEVQVQIAANSDELRGALADGKTDVAHAAVDNAVVLVEKAHLNVVVVMGGEGSTNELMAQPGTTSVESLRGKTLIVDAPITAYAIQLKKILSLSGLQADRDYQLKPIGSTPIRLVAMREHNDYAASILGPPTSVVAKHEGFASLGTTQHFLGSYQGIGCYTRRSWAKENRDTLTNYIAAYIEAQRWLLDRAHKEQVLALLQKEFKLSPTLAQETYEAWAVGPGGLEPDAKIDPDGFQNVLRIRAEIEHTWSGETPSMQKYLDLSYYDAAISKLSAP
jgi:ABC-type nitrate/sulfonate/bicarbonate transport system substrate-binding protein